MNERSLDILEYQYEVSPGQYFQFDHSFTDDYRIRNVIIDQDNYFIKLLTIYPFDDHRDFVMYLEQTTEGAIYRTNYPLRLKENSDTYEAILPIDQ